MKGLERFREAFEAYSENYVIIGGTACDIAMTGTAVRPRATHDIDMIVVVEMMTKEFAEHFWQFVHDAGYRPEKRRQVDSETPKYEFYRFFGGKPDYPEMIELLSRHPDILGEPKGLIVEPLLLDEEISSLSAIIMNDDFYHFTISHSRLTNGIRHADSAALIALKARAYLNLQQDRADGIRVNSKDVKKHRSDVLKNVVIMEQTQVVALDAIVTCIKDFVASIRGDWATIGNPLAKALDQDEIFVEGLLDQLNDLFIAEEK